MKSILIINLAPYGYHEAKIEKPRDILPHLVNQSPSNPLNTVIGSLTNKTNYQPYLPTTGLIHLKHVYY